MATIMIEWNVDFRSRRTIKGDDFAIAVKTDDLSKKFLLLLLLLNNGIWTPFSMKIRRGPLFSIQFLSI